MKHTWLFFVAGAVLSWGAYVVTIDHGRTEMAKGLTPPYMRVAAMRAFLFIGLAYCVMGVVIPGIYLKLNPVLPGTPPTQGADPGFALKSSTLSTIAGLLGAAGALCIVFAVGYARSAKVNAAPAVVASLVFAFAPIINCLLSMLWDRPAHMPNPLFFVGLLMAAGGAALVLRYKPEEAPHAPAKAATQQVVQK